MDKHVLLRDFEKAILQLERGLCEPADRDIVKAGCIQYFEFCFELAWKTIKSFAEHEGLPECNSPRAALKTAFKQGWLPETEWLEMLSDRNRMSHTYDQQSALKIYHKLPSYLTAFRGLYDALLQHNNDSSDQSYAEWLALCLGTAQAAGKAIMEVYGRDFAVDFKADQSPLTEADHASHNIIVNRLKITGLPVLSEESEWVPYETRKDWPAYWLVDPLDGTKEFVKRNGDFTVNIALIEAGRPTLGVVHLPAHDETYWGISGIGACLIAPPARFRSMETVDLSFSTQWKNHRDFFHSMETFWADFPLNGKSCRALEPRTLGDGPLRVVASRSHGTADTDAFTARLEQTDRPIELMARGSALKLCMVAAGEAHIYPRLAPTMEWDTAAAQAVVEAAGGRVVVYDETARQAFLADGPAALFRADPLHYNREELRNPWFVALHPALEREL